MQTQNHQTETLQIRDEINAIETKKKLCKESMKQKN
jgi:hypothetical protein